MHHHNHDPQTPHGTIDFNIKLCPGCGQPRNPKALYCPHCDRLPNNPRRVRNARLRLWCLVVYTAFTIVFWGMVARDYMTFMVQHIHLFVATLASLSASRFIVHAQNPLVSVLRRKGFLWATVFWITSFTLFFTLTSFPQTSSVQILLASLLTLSQLAHILALSPAPFSTNPIEAHPTTPPS